MSQYKPSKAQLAVNAVMDNPHFKWDCDWCGKPESPIRKDKSDLALCDNCYLATFIDSTLEARALARVTIA